jgi:broad specificity phosphatase PhoE
MKIYLCRHGQTTGDIEDRWGGDYDDSLTDEGRKQASEVLKLFENTGVQGIFHSPKKRARETSQIFNTLLGVPMIMVEDLRERSYGVLTGMKRSEAKRLYPLEVDKYLRDRVRHTILGSEHYESFQERIVNAFFDIADNPRFDRIVIVTHGGPISCIVREVLKLGEFKQLGDCAMLELDYRPGKLSLLAMHNCELIQK